MLLHTINGFSQALGARLSASERPEFRRAYVQAMVSRVELGKETIRIEGPKEALLAQAHALSANGELVPTFAQQWRSLGQRDAIIAPGPDKEAGHSARGDGPALRAVRDYMKTRTGERVLWKDLRAHLTGKEINAGRRRFERIQAAIRHEFPDCFRPGAPKKKQ